VLAYFGWPRAHEDDAERAVRAGLAVTAAASRLTAPSGKTLETRIGIATGVVVVGDLIAEGATQRHAVVGETPNLAARLQGVAGPGTVVIAGTTRQLLGDLFALRDLGPQRLKGISDPTPAFAVLGERALGRRADRAHPRARAPGAPGARLGHVPEKWRVAEDLARQVMARL
jgi:class 3 adenylate cyclase